MLYMCLYIKVYNMAYFSCQINDLTDYPQTLVIVNYLLYYIIIHINSYINNVVIII